MTRSDTLRDARLRVGKEAMATMLFGLASRWPDNWATDQHALLTWAHHQIEASETEQSRGKAPFAALNRPGDLPTHLVVQATCLKITILGCLAPGLLSFAEIKEVIDELTLTVEKHIPVEEVFKHGR